MYMWELPRIPVLRKLWFTENKRKEEKEMEDHHYGQKENLTVPDIFDKPIDRTKSRRQAEQRFREPETDIREKLEQLPPLSK